MLRGMREPGCDASTPFVEDASTSQVQEVQRINDRRRYCRSMSRQWSLCYPKQPYSLLGTKRPYRQTIMNGNMNDEFTCTYAMYFAIVVCRHQLCEVRGVSLGVQSTPGRYGLHLIQLQSGAALGLSMYWGLLSVLTLTTAFSCTA
jgi:hypothetical protein